jgi:hypothetical protein
VCHKIILDNFVVVTKQDLEHLKQQREVPAYRQVGKPPPL